MNLDGTSESKHTPEAHNEHTGIQKAEHKPTRLRRFMSIGSRGNNAPIKLRKNPQPDISAPMQTLSPRPTEREPRAKKPAKRSISAFLLSRDTPSKESQAAGDLGSTESAQGSAQGFAQGHLPVTETSSLSLPPTSTKADEYGIERQGHLPVTGDPYHSVQTKTRQDSATKSFYSMPITVSRTAALTSHPVGKEDLEGEEEFQTPGEFWGRQKGEYVEK